LECLRIPDLIAGGRRRFCDFIRKIDQVVAVCQWVREVLERNGVPPEKIMLSRQGLSQAVSRRPRPTARDRRGPLRIAYFGRIDRAKGPDLLARALKMIAKVPVEIDIFAICPAAGTNPLYEWL